MSRAHANILNKREKTETKHLSKKWTPYVLYWYKAKDFMGKKVSTCIAKMLYKEP